MSAAPLQTRASAAAALAGPSVEQIAAIKAHYPEGAHAVVEAALRSRAKIIVMYAEKGGVGKTTQSGSLAWGLAERGHKVLVYDCDAQRSLSNWLLADQINQAPYNQDYDAFVNRQLANATDHARPRTLYQQLEPVRNQQRQVCAHADTRRQRGRCTCVRTHVIAMCCALVGSSCSPDPRAQEPLVGPG